MKFTPKEDFKHGHVTYEAGNTYDSAKHDLSDEEVERFHALGWTEVDGMDPVPERRPGAETLKVAKATHANGST